MKNLEYVFNLLGCKKPFNQNGELSVSGEKARITLLEIVDGLETIDLIKCCDNFEDNLDNIIDSKY
jgi:hypothetical protein